MPVSPKIEEKSLSVNGKKVYYIEAGPEPAFAPSSGRGGRFRVKEETPLVLIHGWLASSNNFHRIITELAKKFHVLAPDLPGFGFENASQELESEHAIASYVDFCHSFIQNQGLKKVGVLGLSMGGTIALEWARRFPQDIEKVVVFEPILGKEDISGLARSLSKVAYSVKPLRRLIRWLVVQGAKREKFVTKLSIQDQKAIFGEIYGGSLKAAAESAWDLLKGVDVDNYRNIQIPVLLVSGGHKTPISSPEAIDKLARILPSAKVEKFNSSNHNLVREEGGAPKFAKILLEFFSS